MDLVEKAKTGDALAFDQLFGPLRPVLQSFLYRRLGDWEVAEDFSQDVLLQAFTHIQQVQAEGEVKPWLFALAHQLSQERLKAEMQWSPDALAILEEYILEKAGVEKDLQAVYQEYQENYHPRYHVEFCFTVTAKSLLHQEQEVFLLREFGDLSWKEIANIVGKEPQEVEQEGSAAMENLRKLFAEKCSLVNKGGSCTQCRDFGNWLNGPEKTKEQLKKLSLQPEAKPERTFSTRLELVQDLDPAKSPVKKFHRAMLGFLRQALGQEGK